MICARCDWTPIPDAGPHRTQLAGHATDAGHPLCPVPKPTHSDPDGICGRSLSSTDPKMACEPCLGEVRANLKVIEHLHRELPAHLRTVAGSGLGGTRSAADGRPLPGGSVLALLAPGSHGGAARRLTRTDIERGEEGREHQADNRPEDTASVHWSLMTWCIDISETWRDGAYADEEGKERRASTVPDLVSYLEVRARPSANQHPAFDEFCRDIRDLRSTLDAATNRTRRPTAANARCFTCRGDLVRRITDEGFEEDHVTCRSCGEQYDARRYLLVLADAAEKAARFTDPDGEEWATHPAMARDLRRSETTIRVWVHRGLVRQTSLERVLFVNVADCSQRAEPRRAG